MYATRSMFALLVVMLAYSAGCVQQKKAADEIDFGTLQNGVYKNTFFGLTVTIPAEWSFQDQQARQQMMDAGGRALAGDDKNLQASLKASEMTTVHMFAAFQHPLGSAVDSNPSIMCMAERISHAPGVKRGSDYLYHSKRALEAGQMQVSFPQEFSAESLGGREFDVMHVEMVAVGRTVRQKYYATIMKGYALAFIVSFTSDEEETLLQDILKTTTFSNG